MEGHDPERGWNSDDWFDEPDTSEPLPRRGSRRSSGDRDPDDSWVTPDQPRAAPRRTRPATVTIGGRTLTTSQLGILLLALVAVILALLAAVGAFSSSSKKAPPTLAITTNPPPTTHRTTTTQKPQQPTVTVPTGTLKPGDTGAKVKQLQRALGRAGYSPGGVDGAYGPGTKDAVTKFQTAHGLTADGVAGPKTLAALKRALSKSG